MGILALFVLIIWLLASLKTSRSDGELMTKLHPYRRLMSYIMPTRNESVVYFDEFIGADKLLAYVEEAGQKFPVDITHCFVAACAIGLLNTQEMNRFVVGRRLYQRKGNFITFSMKRKRLNKKAKIASVKTEIPKEKNL